METRSIIGALGTITVVGLVGLGAYTLLIDYGVDAAGNEFQLPGLTTLLLTALVVAGLALVGVRGAGWRHTPYW